MEQNDQALAAALAGDRRGAVGERCPGAVVQGRVRLGQHLAAHRHVAGHGHAEERAFACEGGELLRLVPAHGAAEHAPATPELHRYEIVVGRRKPRAGKAHQHAAVVDPFRELLARLGDIADIGEDHHRQALLHELGDRLRWRAALGQAHVGERPERA